MNPAALAYVNHGRIVADCPRPHCGSAERLFLLRPPEYDPFDFVRCRCGRPMRLLIWDAQPEPFHCRACHAETPVQWPPDIMAICDVLSRRGAPQWMNWFPDGHPVALKHGCPHGQSVAGLQAETIEHAAEIAAWRSFGQIEEGGGPLSLGPAQ